MSNVLPSRVVSDIKNLALRGHGIRAIARALGIGKNTVKRYYPREEDPRCPCGRPAGHQGWCKNRYANSISRQAFHAGRSGKVIPLPPTIQVSRASARRKTILRWLGKEGEPEPVPYYEMYSIIGEGDLAVRKFPPEFREDIRQEVIVGACEGRIRREEIAMAAKFFLGLEWGRAYSDNFSLDQILDGRGYDAFLVESPWGGSPRKGRK